MALRSYRQLSRRPIVQRIIVANAVIILAGAILGTYITRELPDVPNIYLIVLFFSCGMLATAITNLVILRGTVRPLLELSAAMADIHKGQRDPKLLDPSSDPELEIVSTALADLLDRLEGESHRYSQKLFDSIEEERRRIGRELHDETSQTLAAALINLDQAKRMLLESAPKGATEAEERVENCKRLIRHSLDQIKLLVYDLRPSMLDDLGLVPALRWYITSHVDPDTVDVITEFDEVDDRLPAEIETALYRIAQESLSNVLKHSEASRVTVRLETKPDRVALAIDDNGHGFDVDDVMIDIQGRYGIGLPSIRERAEVLDGTAEIESGPDGTRVHVVIPLGEGEST
jgi:two-component system, NarL family, sensor histidine kinase UhpB